MKSLLRYLIRNRATDRIVQISILAGYLPYLGMHDLLKWQMLVITILMVLIIGLEITSIILTRSFISGKNLGWVAVVILPAGVF